MERLIMPPLRSISPVEKITHARQIILVLLVMSIAMLARPALAQAPAAAGKTLRIPLTIDYMALNAALKQQLYTDHGRAPIWNGDDVCQYFYAENPQFSRNQSLVKMETDGHLMIGASVGGNCVSPVVWNGIIEADTAPFIAPHLQLKFRVTDINLYNQQHVKTLLAGQGFDLVKQHYIPMIETFSFDLSPAFQQFEALIKAGAPPEVADRVQQTLATLRAEPQLIPEDNGVRATIDLTVPAFAPIAAPPAPAQLTPQELANFEKSLDQWDAFLVYSIKELGESSQDPQLRDDLLGVLIDSRHRLIDALAHPQSGGPDPVRLLFLDEWQRLGQVIRDAAQRGTLGSNSLQFLSFMSAGDALFAFDQAAPALGLRISADDLRRLAHMLAPTSAADPLSFTFDEDPELKKMFHVNEPLASEGPLDTSSSIVATPLATAIASPPAIVATPIATAIAAQVPGTAAPPPSTPWPSMLATPALSSTPNATAAPPNVPTPAPDTSMPSDSHLPLIERDLPPEVLPTPVSTPLPSPSPISLMLIPWRLFTPSDADAADLPSVKIDLAAKLQEVSKKLKRVVVNAANAPEYRGNVGQLLHYGAQHEIAQENIDYRYRGLYGRLVDSTAWQESCWRQFIINSSGNRVTYLESSTGDIGLMQVNKHVWRGFYNIDRLEWDVLYNAGAGMQILARLLDDTELKRGAFSAGKPDELARSIYSAYNGGPSSYRRWRGHEPHFERIIDDSFWQKYQAVLHGHQIDILSCAEDWGAQH
ncbi:MAG TPA: transglycosylase SLT domain-containing protein [Candidatus Binataceae bacterium]|nr:transglycosylase SLT domain-containing protein [Candidatus Binataceae bacterium]